MKTYKIAVVGPIPADTIVTFNGETIKKYGCVTHPTIALAKLLEGKGEVIPITHTHTSDYPAICALFKAYPNINTTGIYHAKNKGTVIELRFIDQNNRIEKQISKMSPITPEDVAPFLDADCFVFVPITDFEIELETLQFIKNNSTSNIIFDAHGPTTFVTKAGKRLRQYWQDKEQWLPYIDVLKMNLEESLCCWFDKDYTQEAFYDENATEHLDDLAQYALNLGVKTMYITLDSRGCMVYETKNKHIHKEFIPSVAVENVVDTTGCGDSFAGGLAYGFVMHSDPIKAAHYANVLGALRTQGKDFKVFKSLAETEKILTANY